MSKNIIPIVCLFALLSCSPRIYQPQSNSEVKDSVRIEIHERVVHDTISIEIPREIEKIVTRDTLSRLENTYAVSEAKVTEGYLHHSLQTKHQSIPIPVTHTVRDTIYIEKQQAHKEDTKIVTVERNFTKWQSFEMVCGDLFLLICGILLIVLIVKLIIKRFL